VEIVWSFLKKLNIGLPYDPAIPFLGIYQKECKTVYKRNSCTLIFVATLCTIAKIWNQFRYPYMDKENVNIG
jgi:hypothetical protein